TDLLILVKDDGGFVGGAGAILFGIFGTKQIISPNIPIERNIIDTLIFFLSYQSHHRFPKKATSFEVAFIFFISLLGNPYFSFFFSFFIFRFSCKVCFGFFFSSFFLLSLLLPLSPIRFSPSLTGNPVKIRDQSSSVHGISGGFLLII
ncbi:MAG: hypothetical protein ACK2T7_02535, partial [Anaerolineales bacterium]